MKPLLLTLSLSFCLSYASAQKRDALRIQGFFDMGWVVGPSHPNAQLDYGISVDYTPGIRLLKPFWQWGDVAVELSYHNVHYHLDQNPDKLLPNATLHDRERFYIHVLNLGLAHRWHTASGWYFDTGANIDWNFRKSHMVKNPDPQGNDQKVYNRDIDYFAPVNFDVFTRIGKGRWTMHYIYRLTPLLKPASGLPTLPPHIAGIGLSI